MAGVVPGQSVAAREAAGRDASVAVDAAVFGGLRISRATLLGSEPGVNTGDLVEPRSPVYGVPALGRALPGTLQVRF